MFATFVDSVFALARSCSAAMPLAQRVETALMNEWNLNIKAGSKKVMTPRGSAETIDHPEWKHVSECRFIGHWLSYDCSTARNWKNTKRSMLGDLLEAHLSSATSPAAAGTRRPSSRGT